MIPRSSLATHPASRPRAKNVLAVASGKGGVGKTWFSITLAHALAASGRRVLLFDGDLGLANVDIQLGLAPEHDLGQVIDGRIDLRAAVTRAEAGFDIIAGRSGSGSLAVLAADKLAALRDRLYTLAAGYDHVIVDLGAGVDAVVRAFATTAGALYVVTTDEPTAITDAYALIKVVQAVRRETDFALVVNMAEDARHGRATYETIRRSAVQFLKLEPRLAGIVRRDGRVKDSIRYQTPILTRSPNAEAADDVGRIARAIAGA